MTNDPTRPAEVVGDGLLEPHGLDGVGESLTLPPATPAEAEAAVPSAERVPGSDAANVPVASVVEAPVAPATPGVAPEPPQEGEAPERPEEPEAPRGPGDAGSERATEADASTPSRPPRPRTVGGLIAESLHAAGVKFAFTVPGESFLGLLESLADAGIRVIATRHESGAAFMAEAYGQLTGRPAACLGTRAVGAANLAIGVHTARADSTPMFVLVGQVRTQNRGLEAFQEVDVAATVGGLSTWSAEIGSPASAAGLVAEAVRRALGGRPGPVLLACPEDVIDAEAPESAAPAAPRAAPARPDSDAVRAAIQLVATAERPVILAGAGVLRSRCSRELVHFAELLRVPVIASWRRGDVFPNDHPLYLGMSGYFAPESVRARLRDADALLVLGCRLNEPTSLDYAVPAPGQRWGHVDVEPFAANGAGAAGTGAPATRRPAPTLAIASDAAVFLRAAVARLERGVLDVENARRREDGNARARDAYEAASAVDAGTWSGPGVHPGRIVATLRSVLPDDAIVATDAGNFGGWLARGFRFRRPATFLGPTSGAMGYAVPAAVAAAIVHRDRPVVAVAGDGGFAMTMVELETAVRERVRPIVLVFDNERYGTIRMHQDRREPGRGIGTDLGPIDFVRVAEGLGARGVRVDSTDAFEPALREALAADRPTVIHLPLDRAWVSIDDSPVSAVPSASPLIREPGKAAPNVNPASPMLDAEVQSMTDRDLGGVGDRDAVGGSGEVAAGAQNTSRTENTTVTDHPSEGGVGMGVADAQADRADRDPGETERGDDDWSSIGGPEAFGPADAPSGASDTGGS